jgi:hypothetical protein
MRVFIFLAPGMPVRDSLSTWRMVQFHSFLLIRQLKVSRLKLGLKITKKDYH